MTSFEERQQEVVEHYAKERTQYERSMDKIMYTEDGRNVTKREYLALDTPVTNLRREEGPLEHWEPRKGDWVWIDHPYSPQELEEDPALRAYIMSAQPRPRVARVVVYGREYSVIATEGCADEMVWPTARLTRDWRHDLGPKEEG